MTPSNTDGCASMGQLSGMRVLVVEDEFLISLELSATVEDAGGRAVVAASLDEARTCLAEAGPFDAAILDVRLGKEEVFPVADALAARGTPFVFHSGHACRESLRDRYGRSEILAKPASPVRLVSALMSVVGARTTVAA